ncbi:auxin-induced in root cultures protein 12-like [Cynara cardunculus var. scolymus]|uniref:auxin-induced in root cultures protein 12-like n=1 Tax=Cynara cardunculus var. scolymus TaxID=59895 RepID=UPI000D62DACC|nr:auxin-induced in root cultures protein 12-like [Cynara cardunculus var. scolymus]
MAVLRPSPPPFFFFFLILTLTSLVLRSSPVHSLNCSSEKFTNNKLYSNCTDLPTLNSTLHWTFTPQNSTLDVAFIAPPATPNGWIAWAINPTGTGMIGCQSLIAFKNSKGSMTVKTYNISSYSSIEEGKVSFEVPESSAEFSGGVMKIFAMVKLPKTITEVNHVWQVGSSVKDGVPQKHGFSPENMKAMGKLQLEGKSNATSTAAGNTTAGNTTAGSTTASPSTGASSGTTGIYAILIFFACLLISS